MIDLEKYIRYIIDDVMTHPVEYKFNRDDVIILLVGIQVAIQTAIKESESK